MTEIKASFPIDLEEGLQATSKNLERYYKHTEKESNGGFFPIGASTTWHSGIHIRTSQGSAVHACADGVLIGARLSGHLDSTLRSHGHTNFLLIKHNLPGKPEKTWYSFYYHLSHPPIKANSPFLQKIGWTNKVDINRFGGNNVIKLDSIPVKAGEQIWISGICKDGNGKDPEGRIHWEIFSETKLFDDMKSMIDADSDWKMDAKELLKMVDTNVDGRLWSSELIRFYHYDANAMKLRNYAYRFIHESALTLSMCEEKAKSLNLDRRNLEHKLSPFLWWDEAVKAGVPLPASPHVWHYNPITIIKRLDRLRVRFECLKVVSSSQKTAWTPIHSYRLYLFYKKDGVFYRYPDNDVPAQQIESIDHKNPKGYTKEDIGKCDYPFTRSATYYCYFAGKELNDKEIDLLKEEGENLLIRITIDDSDVVRINQSFFWWICLLQNIEAEHKNTLETLTKVRKLYYNDDNWDRLIDTDVSSFFTVDKKKNGKVSKSTTVPLKVLFSIGKSYFQVGDQFTTKDGDPDQLIQKTDDIENSNFHVVEREKWFGLGKNRWTWIYDRHDFVIFPKIGAGNKVKLNEQGKTMQISHVLTGIEVVHYEANLLGKHAFEYRDSAATWGGDLGQAVQETIENYTEPDDPWFESDQDEKSRLKKEEELAKKSWEKTVLNTASIEELAADLHGYQLREKLKDQIQQNQSLSSLLESYFNFPKEMETEKKNFKEYAGKNFQNLKHEIIAFANTWEERSSANKDFDDDNLIHQQIVQWALEYFEETFEQL